MNILEVKNLTKTYHSHLGLQKVEALRGLSFSVKQGEFIAIMGESGSGKTTLLNLLAALDQATTGSILLEEEDMSLIKAQKLTAFRRQHIGFVFQDFNLLDTLSVKDNILLPLVLSKHPYGVMDAVMEPIVDRLGITDLLAKYPYELSGGQKQRVATARALITHPKLLLADEPTGALDSKTAVNLLEQLRNLGELGQTIIMVTHSAMAASYARRILFIRDGLLFHQLHKGERTQQEMAVQIADTLQVLLGGNMHE